MALSIPTKPTAAAANGFIPPAGNDAKSSDPKGPTPASGSTSGTAPTAGGNSTSNQSVVTKLKKYINDNKMRFPLLFWEKAFRSDNGYIDNIPLSHMRSSVMYGIDENGEPCLSIKTVILECDADNKPKGNPSKPGVETFFEHAGRITSGGHHGHGVHLVTETLTEAKYAQLMDLIARKDIVIDRPHLGGRVILRLA